MDAQKARILVVEDEPSMRNALRMNLEMEDYEVVVAGRGDEALQRIREERFHLIILDIMLPGVDGITLCQQIRLEDDHTPILFLTAKNTTSDTIQGLKAGADDYLAKPFNLEEFLLRVQVLVKRAMIRSGNAEELMVYRFGDNTVNFQSYEAQTPEGTITLTRKEIMLLKLLVTHANQVVSRQDILHYVWGYDVYPSTRTIDNFILAFRKYFEKDPRNPKHFHSVRGVGYKFTP